MCLLGLYKPQRQPHPPVYYLITLIAFLSVKYSGESVVRILPSGVPCSGVPCSGVPCSGVPCSGVPCSGVPLFLVLLVVELSLFIKHSSNL